MLDTKVLRSLLLHKMSKFYEPDYEGLCRSPVKYCYVQPQELEGIRIPVYARWGERFPIASGEGHEGCTYLVEMYDTGV